MCKYIQKKWGALLSILGIINFALLIPLLCMHFPRIIDSNLGFDYMGVIVGVLSLLVTVLVGWNIYIALDIKKEWEKYKKDIDKYTSDLQNKEKEFKKEINNVKNDLEAFRQYGYAITDFCQVYTKLEPIKENYTDTYCKLLNAFRCFAKSNEKAIWYAPACIENLKESLKKVHELKELFTEEHEIKISKYIDEIMSISKSELSQYKTEIIKIEEDKKKYKNE